LSQLATGAGVIRGPQIFGVVSLCASIADAQWQRRWRMGWVDVQRVKASGGVSRGCWMVFRPKPALM
jgi:hypothetical protein